MNDNAKTAERIKRIARNLVAGGGAGIEFLIKKSIGSVDYRVTADYDERNGKFVNIKVDRTGSNLAITSFSAEGYYDGMSNVDGRRVFSSVEIDDGAVKDAVAEDLGYAADEMEDDDDLIQRLKDGIKCSCEIKEGPEAGTSVCIFAGWTRGTLKEGDTIEFINDLELHYDGGLYGYWNTTDINEVTVTATLSENGEYWYKDVFENDEPEEDEADLLDDLYGSSDED